MSGVDLAAFRSELGGQVPYDLRATHDLFAAGGGWDHALELLGLDPRLLLGFEWSPVASTTARLAGYARFVADVAKIDPAAITEQIGGLIGSPPCFVAGTPVITHRGVVAIEDVQVGDTVLTHRNRWRAVTATMKRQAERTVRVGQIVATPDHRFYSRQQIHYRDPVTHGETWRLGEPEWVPAAKTQGSFLATPMEVETLILPSPWRSWWMVGRWIADGWANDRGEVCIAIGAGKEADFEQRAGQGFRPYHSGPSCRRYTVIDRDAANWLRRHFGSGAKAKTLPGWVFGLPEADRRDLLAGYLSGDGTVRRTGWRAVTVSALLAAGLRTLAVGLGHTVSVNRVQTSATKKIEGRTVRQSDWYAINIVEKNDGRYTRDEFGHRWSKQRKTVEDCGPAEVFDLTVDEDHSFTAWGFVVHNCQGFSLAGNGEGRKDIALMRWAIREIANGRDPRADVASATHDERSVLVLEPLRWALELRPRWMAWEQVESVKPLWESCAEVLQENGYSVWSGVLDAIQYDVPQSPRKRSVLLASMDVEVARPAPVRSAYYSRDPLRLDSGLEPWLSITDVLPHRVGQSMRSNYGSGGDPKARGVRRWDQPSFCVTSKIGRNKWSDGTAVSIAEASMLQTFPVDHPWFGVKAEHVTQQIGDAVPPMLAAHCLAALGVGDLDRARSIALNRRGQLIAA